MAGRNAADGVPAPSNPDEERGLLLKKHDKLAYSSVDKAQSKDTGGGPPVEIHVAAEDGPANGDHCSLRRHQDLAEHLSSRVRFAVNLSIACNVILSASNLYAAIRSGSLAVLASLVDTLLDLVSQVVLFAAERCMQKPSDQHYPAGRSRIEPVGVIIVSVLMGVAALELLRASATTLAMALLYHQLPHLDMNTVTIGILCVSVVVKCGLYALSSALAKHSGTAAALSADHRNDILTNGFSVVSSLIAHYRRDLWFVDATGAIIISLLILRNWIHMGVEHAAKIVGLSAPPETLQEISDLASKHHASLTLDIIRAYHFGPNFLVELEVVLPEEMRVKEAHDIALSLQQKIERQHYVERCFVHIDYMTRDFNEHKI